MGFAATHPRTAHLPQQALFPYVNAATSALFSSRVCTFCQNCRTSALCFHAVTDIRSRKPRSFTHLSKHPGMATAPSLTLSRADAYTFRLRTPPKNAGREARRHIKQPRPPKNGRVSADSKEGP